MLDLKLRKNNSSNLPYKRIDWVIEEEMRHERQLKQELAVLGFQYEMNILTKEEKTLIKKLWH